MTATQGYHKYTGARPESLKRGGNCESGHVRELSTLTEFDKRVLAELKKGEWVRIDLQHKLGCDSGKLDRAIVKLSNLEKTPVYEDIIDGLDVVGVL